MFSQRNVLRAKRSSTGTVASLIGYADTTAAPPPTAKRFSSMPFLEGVAFMSGILFALLFSWNLLAATPAGCEGKKLPRFED
jgi:hypothetical protein